jgi:hypothetical protein
MPEWRFEGLAVAGTEAVERHREVVDPNQRHELSSDQM